jgi:hypothetical protein
MRMRPTVQVIPILFQSETDSGEPVCPCQINSIARFHLPVRRPSTGRFRIFICCHRTEKKTILFKAYFPAFWEELDAAWRGHILGFLAE